MSKVSIQVENLSKQYRLGVVGTGTISHDLNRWWARVRGREDPFLTIGEVNDRTVKGSSDYVWALKDLNFQVKQGEVLGVIGKNGAGKSTLLKLLSKVTGPTTGRIKANGRIGALLEVGTGFHPELTGRENVFLNGALLGMTKNEIRLKLDEIVDFSGCERYIDTPVKRYSSGMKVRLAFAVAAFLEPEILIVDEVLAVGDAEFRKKCIGKMGKVAQEGRTILFVSHNMDSIRNLCQRAIFLENGQITLDGSVDDAIRKYVQLGPSLIDYSTGIVPDSWERPWGHEDADFKTIRILNSKGEYTSTLLFKEPLIVEVAFDCDRDISDTNFQLRIGNVEGTQITRSVSTHDVKGELDMKKGKRKALIEINPQLVPGRYALSVYFGSRDGAKFYDAIADFYHFEITNESLDGFHEVSSKQNTFIHLNANWKFY
ncbi:ABC transporter ATP-binding protein [Roseivirga misakiensis]|uniref:ABC transporter domain-containing protein n=1 Tax=Roseivirga misakiensis TaxID=1563681 RepID=A0A1E5T1J4_9BACT|nr:ABC transporter ATP-binding protein [Roseivirga misakiensis]OEK05231.1 hypothetical protein BFP71_17670 [Roseivirga misakiensis]